MCFGYIGKKNTHFQLVMEYGFKTRIPDCPEVEGEWAWNFLFIDICCSSFVGNEEDFVIFACTSKMFLHQVCWKHHCNFLWIPFFCLFLAFFIRYQYCASQFQEDDPEILWSSPRQNFVSDLESINWYDQIFEERSLIQSCLILSQKFLKFLNS